MQGKQPTWCILDPAQLSDFKASFTEGNNLVSDQKDETAFPVLLILPAGFFYAGQSFLH